jgi:hypothetical protein
MKEKHQTRHTFACEDTGATDSEGREPAPPGVILTDHIPGDRSPPRALCYTQRTSLDTPEGATEHQTPLGSRGASPALSGVTPKRSNSNL